MPTRQVVPFERIHTDNEALNRIQDNVAASLDPLVSLLASQANNALLTGATLTDLLAAIALKLNTADYTAADVFAKVLSLDGAASLLDADVLDGQEGSFYLALANATGTLAAAKIDAAIARLASPAFTGNPTAPTPAGGDNDTSIATTAFVGGEIATHAAASDPHTGYQKESEKGSPSGYAALNSGGYLEQRHPRLHVSEEQTSGTDAGTFTSGAWRTRALNTTRTNEITGASLASNQITLPAGTYRMRAYATAFAVNVHKVKFYNITDSTDVAIGTSLYTEIPSGPPVSRDTTQSWVHAQFTIAGTKVFELQHRCQTTRGTNGMGVSSVFSVVEVYAEVIIDKVA